MGSIDGAGEHAELRLRLFESLPENSVQPLVRAAIRARELVEFGRVVGQIQSVAGAGQGHVEQTAALVLLLQFQMALAFVVESADMQHAPAILVENAHRRGGLSPVPP